MPLLMGPVLSFRGSDEQNWKLTALIVADSAPGSLTLEDGTAIAPVALWKVKGSTAYRYAFSFPIKAAASTNTYKVMSNAFKVAIPGANQPPRMAYESCNGFSSLKLMKGVKEPHNALWNAMATKHGQSAYHLIVQGGDQVYADAMWETVDVMKEWLAKDWTTGNNAAVTPAMTKALNEFYFDLYTDRWSQPEVAAMLASVPSIAMWDDHDLIDGWGSYPEPRQTCAVFGAIWKTASKAFAVFQQHLKDSETREGAIGARPDGQFPVKTGAFSYGYDVGGVSILAIDMRSQRNEKDQVIGSAHWDEIYKWIDARKNVSHLLVMSSIPVVYPGFDTIETVLGIYPGHQDLEDDLRDHWRSRPHKAERLRMVHRLMALPAKKIRVTIISGDVHVAAIGILENSRDQKEAVINQLISSGIVHPGPGGIVLFALRYLFDSADEIDRGIVGRMIQFPGSSAKFIGSRNYLSLEPDNDMRIWCNWIVEKETATPYTKVIHSLDRP